MKVYISADIEGITGVTHWDETKKNSPDYAEFRDQMNREVAAACEAAFEAGATDVWVKDAHDSTRNLEAEKLPEGVTLVRGMSGNPLFMVQEIERGFDACAFIGYHAAAATGDSPLAHTFSTDLTEITINGEIASEVTINTYAAAMHGVPLAFVAGDAGACGHAVTLSPGVKTAVVQEGVGGSTVSVHPKTAVANITAGMKAALEDLPAVIDMPKRFDCVLTFKESAKALRASFYPGARLAAPHVVEFASTDYRDVLNMLMFTTS